jgi:hypothetical protein
MQAIDQAIDQARARAGFWRRSLACMIDALCISLPFSLLAGFLFAASHGAVQMASPGLNANWCQTQAEHPAGLDPPPPEGSNFSRTCRFYSLSGQTGQVLIVGRVIKANGYQKVVAQTYLAGPDGVEQ